MADLHLAAWSASLFTSARLSAVSDARDELLPSSTRASVCTSPLRSCFVGCVSKKASKVCTVIATMGVAERTYVGSYSLCVYDTVGFFVGVGVGVGVDGAIPALVLKARITGHGPLLPSTAGRA